MIKRTILAVVLLAMMISPAFAQSSSALKFRFGENMQLPPGLAEQLGVTGNPNVFGCDLVIANQQILQRFVAGAFQQSGSAEQFVVVVELQIVPLQENEGEADLEKPKTWMVMLKAMMKNTPSKEGASPTTVKHLSYMKEVKNIKDWVGNYKD